VPSPDLSTCLQVALGLYRARRLDEARIFLERAIKDHPHAADARLLLARVQVDLQLWQGALDSATAALASRACPSEAWYALGRAYKGRGLGDAARNCYRRALLTEPRNPAILTSLGTALYEIGRRDAAIHAYQRALEAHPGDAGARASLEHILGGSSAAPERLIQIQDDVERLKAAGRLQEALNLHHEALRIAPRAAGIWLSAGRLAYELGEIPGSLPLFEKAASLAPSLFPAVEAARRICAAAGLTGKAQRYADLSCALRPSDEVLLAKGLAVAAIQPSVEAMRANRLSFEQTLDRARAANLKIGDVEALVQTGSFYLAYHGENDRRLLCKASTFLREAVPDLVITAAHCERGGRRGGPIRVGFISAFLYAHSIGKTTRGLIAQLARDRFEVTALRITPSKQDKVTELMRAEAARMVDLDPDFRTARKQIAALELDVLFYQDIGMEPTSYLLAHSRLAPVQCVSFGHPNTTGIPNMDYFISNDLYEPADADSHYSEELFLLRDLPTIAYYYRPDPPAVLGSRAEFGLRDADHVYLCPQTLFKLHPEFDALIGGILGRDPDGIVVLIRGQYDDYAEQILQRFARSLADFAERILLLDPMPFARFMQLLTAADVCLDTPHFNGMNSSLEALSVGTPIVTLPGRLQRGRHTQAMYRKMKILDCIASDASHYIEIAVRLGCDQEFAKDIRERILANNAVLYEDPRVVRELERFFREALREKRPSTPWQSL
jgi:predicted O-linked N-acetylglucosamine transferase (SPINDLY family)